ncbi:MAG: hypothetical protein R3E93_04685 [Thiothrix sp.]
MIENTAHQWPGKPALSPANIMLLTLLFILLLQAVAAYIFTHQPWTGLRLEPDPHSGFLRVTSVAEDSPAEGIIPPGTLLAALQTAERQIPLTPFALIDLRELNNHDIYADSIRLQQQLHAAVKFGEPLRFASDSGNVFAVEPRETMPVRAIPTYYWVLWSLGCVGLLICSLVWSYQPFRLEALFLFITSVGYYGFSVTHNILSNRELFMAADVLDGLNFGAVLFTHYFIFGMFMLQVSYPVRLFPLRLLYVVALLDVLLSVNYYLKIIELPLHIFFLQYVPFFMVALGFTVWQWRASKGHPLNRVALLLLQISIMFPSLIAVVFYAIPLIMGKTPLLSHTMVIQVMSPIIFIGWAGAVLRYRLFEIEYWWFKSWLWLLGGALVILLDVVLVTLFYTPQVYALGLSVVLAGFLYFPLRQWLLGKLMPLDGQSVQDFLPTFGNLMSGAVSGEEFEQRWQAVLQKRFRPLHLDAQPDVLKQPMLAENGLHLSVPALDNAGSYRLTGKQMAAHLFSKADVHTVASLLDIARIASNASATRKQAVLAERRRVMHDLHDTIGARLLSLSHDITSPQHRKATQDTLQLLRDMIHLTLQKTPYRLEEHLADWRADTVEQTEAVDAQLRWQTEPQVESLALPPSQLIELMLFVRETVDAFLQQPDIQSLDIAFRLESDALLADISINNQPLTAKNLTIALTGQA